jgi:hypothetical protein
VQEPFAGIEPPVNVTAEPPAETVAVPPQVVLAMPVTITPLGSVSVSGAVRLAAVAFGLLRLIVSVELPPAVMEAGLKDLFTVGATPATGVTAKLATAGTELLPLLVCKAPAASELMKLPALGAVTFTVTVQEPFAGIEPPVNVTAEPPAGAVTVPPQVVLTVPETVTPLGNVSTSGAVKLAAVAFALLKSRVRVEMPPAVIEAGLKDLFTVGGVTATAVHAETETVLLSMVTAPFCARALPDTVASAVKVMLVSARMLPTKLLPAPMVAELPTCQETLHCSAPLIRSTAESLAVVSVLPISNTHAAVESPPASRVSIPVN